MTKDKSEYIENWLFRANEDIAVIASLVNSGAEYYTSSICFHAQQASEKFLKAYLAYHDVDFPRTHDLDYLLLECQKIDKNAFQLDFKSLTDFGVSVRYPDDFYIPTENEALEYRDVAISVKEIVERLIK
ncbi:MAG: HEPN domain-containing protein [Ignavibacteriaceae bacterium]|jgi:HEPN domain-containing protein|nr:HEPN domain-containing protein [Ignavibacteriaceae bacterium]